MFKIIHQNDCFKTCNKWAFWSNDGVLFTSTFVSKELSAPSLGLYTCIKALRYIPGTGVRWAFTVPLVLWFSIISTEIPLICFLEDYHVYVNNWWGYSLESHRRCVFNEYPQRVLWRNKQNYPLIITKYPSYLFHFLCAQRRLRSAWASAHSDQSLHCPLIEQLRSLHADSEDSDQKGRMHSLIWIFTRHIGHFIGFVMLRFFLIIWYSLIVFEKETRFLPTTDPSLFDRVG